MTRTDVHRPSALVTEDYEFAYAYDSRPEWGDGGERIAIVNSYLERGYRFGGVSGGGCDHCGNQNLRYIAVLTHEPTRTLIRVGETCLDNRFSLATAEFQTLRTQAKLNREQATRAERVARFLADNPALVPLTERPRSEVVAGSEFLSDIGDKILQGVELSPRQIEAAIRVHAQQIEFAQRKAARDAEEAAAKAAGLIEPAPTGKTVVTGTVLTTKLQESQYGNTWKMLVKDDRGFKVWCSIPVAIADAAKDMRVTFSITLEPSKDDPYFSFGKRPTQAAFLTDGA
ncbi:MAG: hypothetical protein NVS3B1_06180 [Marmoricola sp.]